MKYIIPKIIRTPEHRAILALTRAMQKLNASVIALRHDIQRIRTTDQGYVKAILVAGADGIPKGAIDDSIAPQQPEG